MKRSFLLLCTVLLVLGCALPCAAYRLACMALVVQGTAPSAAEAASVTSEESSRVASSPADTADTVCFMDQSTGQTITLPLREYLIGAVAAEMPVSWPDEALKAQAVAAHSYALYRRDHSTEENGFDCSWKHRYLPFRTYFLYHLVQQSSCRKLIFYDYGFYFIHIVKVL